MDIDELTEEFIQAYDAWCADDTHGMGGSAWEEMLKARDALEVERTKYANDNTA